nr:hypothetical protein CFP56_36277 [Quercus suber]
MWKGRAICACGRNEDLEGISHRAEDGIKKWDRNGREQDGTGNLAVKCPIAKGQQVMARRLDEDLHERCSLDSKVQLTARSDADITSGENQERCRSHVQRIA